MFNDQFASAILLFVLNMFYELRPRFPTRVHSQLRLDMLQD
jgi:hypothetical protein